MAMASSVQERYCGRNRMPKPAVCLVAVYWLSAIAKRRVSSTPSGSVRLRMARALVRSLNLVINQRGLSGIFTINTVYRIAGIASTPSIHLQSSGIPAVPIQ